MENTIEAPLSEHEESIIKTGPEKKRCAGITKSGVRCANYTTRGTDYCPIHQDQKPVEVKRETVPAEPKVDEERLMWLNASASFILDQLMPEVSHELKIACQDHQIPDIGIYIMGLLNRLYKTVDYYNPDIEPEWDKRIVGYSDKLICKNCNHVINNPIHLRQVFCSNACAKEFKDSSKTGVIYPVERDLGTEEEQDEKAWEAEQQRQYGA